MAKIVMGIAMVSIVAVGEVWLFVEAVLDVVAIISKAGVLAVHIMALVSEVVAEAVVSEEQRV